MWVYTRLSGKKRSAQYKHYYNGEKNKQGEGGGLRIQSLVLIPLGNFELHFWLCQPQTHKTTV